MKLTDLDPQFVFSGGEGVSQRNPATGEYEPAPLRTGVGLGFNCPCGCGERVYVGFENPLDGGPKLPGNAPTWTREGDTFETLTLRPSIQRIEFGNTAKCRWHGYITNGEALTV